MTRRNKAQEHKRKVAHKQLVQRGLKRTTSSPLHTINQTIKEKDAVPLHYKAREEAMGGY